MKPFKGFLLAPIVGAFFGTLLMSILSNEVSLSQMPSVLFVYTFVGSIFALFSAGTFGVALYFIFQKLRLTNLLAYFLGGLLCAAPFWIAWFYPFEGGHWESYKYTNSLYFFGVGAIGGLTFWYLVVRPMHSNKALQPTADGGG